MHPEERREEKQSSSDSDEVKLLWCGNDGAMVVLQDHKSLWLLQGPVNANVATRPD